MILGVVILLQHFLNGVGKWEMMIHVLCVVIIQSQLHAVQIRTRVAQIWSDMVHPRQRAMFFDLDLQGWVDRNIKSQVGNERMNGSS